MSQKCNVITQSAATKSNGKNSAVSNDCQKEQRLSKAAKKSSENGSTVKKTNSKTGPESGTKAGAGAGAGGGAGDGPKTQKSRKHQKKPIVLSSQRYNKIIGNAFGEIQARKDIEEQQKFKEYLKRGNEQLMAHFKSNIQRTQDQKSEEQKQLIEKKNQEARAAAERTKENEQQKRREHVARAHQLVEKLKPGVRELNSAAMQSEVLRVRNVQCKVKEDFQQTIKKFDCEQLKECGDQGIAALGTEAQRIEERQKAAQQHKKEILETINNNRLRKIELRKQTLQEECAARNALDLEIKAQIEREKAIMAKKRQTLRNNAIEAIRISEQRRLRNSMVDELENRLCCVYNTGKHELDQLRLDFSKKQIQDVVQRNEEKSKKVAQYMNVAKDAEMNRVRRDISRMQLKFTEEEQQKIRKEKAAKQARIEAYIREMEQQKRAQQRIEQQRKFEIAQRLKNEEVNCIMNETEKQRQFCKVKNLNTMLLQQIDEKKRFDQLNKFEECKLEKDRNYEHQFYFDYARNLMEHAQKNGRPLYPFVRAIQSYKKENQIECDRRTPRHLVSQVPLGCTPINQQANAAMANNYHQTAAESAARNAILEDCQKINDMILKDGLRTRQNMTAVCVPQCPYDCGYRNGLDDAAAKNPHCSSSKSNLKHRYSMQELRQLNPFPFPPNPTATPYPAMVPGAASVQCPRAPTPIPQHAN